MPFNTPADRYDHWDKHHGDFEPPPLAEADYETRAQAFMTGPAQATMLECTRATGRKSRFDTVSNEYGVVGADGCTITYFKPDPVKHKLASNEDYFRANC